MASGDSDPYEPTTPTNLPSSPRHPSASLSNQSSLPSLLPANGLGYTTAELTTLFSSLESRLTGYAEALSGVAQCLDSLQEQIRAFRDEQKAGDEEERSEDGGYSDVGGAGEKHAVEPREWEVGQRSIGEGNGESREAEPQWRDAGGEEDRDWGQRPEGGGDREVENGVLGNMLSGFVFGSDEGKS